MNAATVPEHLLFTTDHEWVQFDGGNATVGITQFAADALGDIVFIEPPAVGTMVVRGEMCGEIASTKSVSDLLSPVSGEVTEVNAAVVTEPAVVNAEPYASGWIFRVTIAEQPVDLLTAEQYRDHVGTSA
jgi:glycine cleavage system H protein